MTVVTKLVDFPNTLNDSFRQTPAPPRPTNVSETPFNLGGLGGIAGLGGMGIGGTNFMEMQQRMQREV